MPAHKDCLSNLQTKKDKAMWRTLTLATAVAAAALICLDVGA
jgi:hypothetical protein